MPAITICGYGSQGRAQGQNLAESGWEVTIAVRADGPSHRAAMADGMRVITDLRAAASDAQCCALLVADPAQPAMWETVLRPHLPPAATLIFAHGYHLHCRTILPRPDLDILLAGPMCPGTTLVEWYDQRPVPVLTAIAQDATGSGRKTLTAYLAALTKDRYREIPTTVAEETETDLFSEQVLLCGGLAHLILATYETLVEAGYDPTVAYYTAVTEPANLAKLYAEHGLDGAFAQISTTARYGALTRGPRVIDERVRQTLRRILSEIRSGAFATECAAHPAMPASPWANHLIAHPPSTQEPSS